MPKNKVLQNYLYNVSYQIVMTVLPLATIPYLSRVLGAHNLGIVRYLESVVQMMSVFGLLGLVWYANRAVAYERGDCERLSRCFWEIFLMRVILLAATFIVFFAVASRSAFKELFGIYGFWLAGTFLDVSWFFTGIEEMKPVVIRNYIIRIVSTILLFVLINSRGDLVIYCWLTSLTTLANAVAIAPFMRSRLEPVSLSSIHVWRHFIPALALFLPQAASQIYVQCDKILIQHMIGDPSYISFYTENEKIAKVPVVLATALSTVLMPRITYEFSSGRKYKVSIYIRKAFLCTYLMLAPCCAGLIAVAPAFVRIFLGAEFADTHMILRLFCPIMIFIGFSNVTGIQYLVALNRTSILTVSYVTAAVSNLVLDFVFIPIIGIYGAIIGTMTAEILVFSIQYYYMHKDLGTIGAGTTLASITGIALLMWVVVQAFGLLPISAIPRLILQMLLGVLIYTGGILMTGVPKRIMEEW